MEELQARRAHGADWVRSLTFTVLRPVYPAAGRGALRVLRLREREGTVELVAGYESYERLAD